MAEQIKYTEELAKYFGKISNSKPRPVISDEIDENFRDPNDNSALEEFGNYIPRIAALIDWDQELATDGSCN